MTGPARVGVWGGSGYLGRQLVTRLGGPDAVRILGRAELPDGLHFVVDASYPNGDRTRATADAYLAAVERRSAEAAEQGCRYVYLASTSSLPPVTSAYGRLKASAEAAVSANGAHLLRAGLVVSDDEAGGRFGELVAIVERLPVVVLPSHDHFRLYVSELPALLADLEACVGPQAPAADRLVTGTTVTSLAALLAPWLPAGQRRWQLGARTSSLAARVARHLHAGPLDSLASIAVPPPHAPPQEGRRATHPTP